MGRLVEFRLTHALDVAGSQHKYVEIAQQTIIWLFMPLDSRQGDAMAKIAAIGIV